MKKPLKACRTVLRLIAAPFMLTGILLWSLAAFGKIAAATLFKTIRGKYSYNISGM